jgi:four helix bundle protein
MAATFEDLHIYKEALVLFGDIHRFSQTLPSSERFEMGSQIRRASDSITSNIVEGYGRRRHKKDFLRFITISHASGNELMSHLDKIALVYPDRKSECHLLRHRTDILCRRIHTFRKYVEQHWNWKPNDPTP